MEDEHMIGRMWSAFNQAFPGQSLFSGQQWRQICPQWMHTDFYEALGLKELGFKASPEDIKRISKVLARKWHPDKNHNESEQNEVLANFQRINEAMQVLRDPQQRAAYDWVRKWLAQAHFADNQKPQANRQRTAEACARTWCAAQSSNWPRSSEATEPSTQDARTAAHKFPKTAAAADKPNQKSAKFEAQADEAPDNAKAAHKNVPGVQEADCIRSVWPCIFCGKRFRGSDFAFKHLLHCPQLETDKRSKEAVETQLAETTKLIEAHRLQIRQAKMEKCELEARLDAKDKTVEILVAKERALEVELEKKTAECQAQHAQRSNLAAALAEQRTEIEASATTLCNGLKAQIEKEKHAKEALLARESCLEAALAEEKKECETQVTKFMEVRMRLNCEKSANKALEAKLAENNKLMQVQTLRFAKLEARLEDKDKRIETLVANANALQAELERKAVESQASKPELADKTKWDDNYGDVCWTKYGGEWDNKGWNSWNSKTSDSEASTSVEMAPPSKFELLPFSVSKGKCASPALPHQATSGFAVSSDWVIAQSVSKAKPCARPPGLIEESKPVAQKHFSKNSGPAEPGMSGHSAAVAIRRCLQLYCKLEVACRQAWCQEQCQAELDERSRIPGAAAS